MSIRPQIDSTLPTVQKEACDAGAADPCADFLGKGGFSFKTVLDVINPLQQLPVISTAYRALTGDTISDASRLAGGALYGGALGLASAVVNTVVQGITGKDIGATIVAQIIGSSDTQVADNSQDQFNYTPAGLRSANNAYVAAQNLAA